MTAQEVFDTVVAHLRSMPQRSYDKSFGCVYRAPDGNKCAVGCLIKDWEYSPKMEQRDVHGLKGSGLLPDRLAPHVDLLGKLQLAHDWMDNWDESGFVAENRLAGLAETFNLNYTPKEA